MPKRLLAAYLWIAASWTVGSVLNEIAGLSEYVGLVVGVALAVVVLLMPAEVWIRRVSISHSGTESAQQPVPQTHQAASR